MFRASSRHLPADQGCSSGIYQMQTVTWWPTPERSLSDWLTCTTRPLVVESLAAGWVLELVHRYPTAQLLADASAPDLAAIPYLPHKHITALLEQARSSIASLRGDTIEELIR